MTAAHLSEIVDKLLEGFAVFHHIWQRQEGLCREKLMSLNMQRLQAVQKAKSQKKKKKNACLTSLALLTILFRSCSSFSLFCWLVWWMICCHRK